MKTIIAFLTSLALVAPSFARISGIAVPDTIAPGSQFRVIIETENYIQSVEDVAISFGYSPTTSFNDESLGILLSSRFLGPDESNIVNNVTHIVNVPATASNGPIVFSGSAFSLLGAVYSPNIESFTVNTTLGAFTSSNYLSSQ